MQREQMIKAMRSTLDSVVPEAKAYLFGSRARGNARSDSDWDVLILLDKQHITNEDQDRISYPLTELGWDNNEVINPVLFTRSYWDSHSYTPFHHNIMSEGIEI